MLFGTLFCFDSTPSEFIFLPLTLPPLLSTTPSLMREEKLGRREGKEEKAKMKRGRERKGKGTRGKEKRKIKVENDVYKETEGMEDEWERKGGKRD